MRGNITKRGKNSWQLKIALDVVNGNRILSAMTVGEYLRAWLSSTLTQSPKTLERYGELAERRIIPHLVPSSCKSCAR